MSGARRKTKPSPQQAGSQTDPQAVDTPKQSLATIGLGILIVSAIVLVAYWPALSAGALSFDDVEYLTENRLMQNPSWDSAKRFLAEVLEPSTVHGYYQPLNMITLMFDCALGGHPEYLLPFHRTSLILHMLNTALVITLMYLLFNHFWAAAVVGLLFGVHPMAVETIAWVGERKTLLAAFFALLSLISYVRYARTNNRGAYSLTLIMFVLSLMSKPTGMPLPVCFLLLDFWPLKRLNKKAILEKVPHFIIACLFAYITYESQKRTAVAVMFTEYSPLRIPYILCHNIIFYLRNMVWPVGLSSHYAFPSPLSIVHVNVLVGVLGTVGLLSTLAISLRWTRALATGWLYFFVAIFPTMGLVGFTNVIAADKFAYLPSVGLMLPVAYFLARFMGPTRPLRVPRRIISTVVVTAVLALLAGWSTRAYLHHWRDTESHFRYMLSKTPEAATLHFHLAAELTLQGRKDEAIAHYNRVIQFAPHYEVPYINLGILLYEKGHSRQAIQLYSKALEIKPEYAEAHNNLGNALFDRGDIEKAKSHYVAAIKSEPDYADAHYNLANLLLKQGDNQPAIVHYRQALQSDPKHAAAHNNLGSALWQQGELPSAIEHYRAALACRPGWWELANRLAWLQATHKDPRVRNPTEAVRLAERACQITQFNNPRPLSTLAIAYAEAGQLDSARQTAEKAINLAKEAGQHKLAEELQARMQQYKGDR